MTPFLLNKMNFMSIFTPRKEKLNKELIFENWERM